MSETDQPGAGEENITPEERAMLASLEESAREGAQDTINVAAFAPLAEAKVDMKADPNAQDMNLKMVMDIPVEVHVEIGGTRLAIRDILRLCVGSVIELERLAGQPADIIVNGRLIGQGDIVVVNENFGIRVAKLVGLEERIQSL
jgi:flagellar motor switch protein FliN/FliY